MSADVAYLLGLATPFALALPVLFLLLRRAKRDQR